MSKAEKEVGGKGFSGPIVEKSSKQQMLSKNLSSGVEGDLSIILFCTSLGKLLLTDLESIEQKYISCWLSITDLLVGDICRMYSARNLEMTICFSLKSRLSERFQRPEMSQIKADISLRTNLKLIFHKTVGLK